MDDKILEKLTGGDLRSIGRANEVAEEVENNPKLFGPVFSGMACDDPVVRMRSADVIEKVTRKNPKLLLGYTSKVISLLISSKQQEVCWHLAQIAPRLNYEQSQENEVIEVLKGYLMHKSKIVQVSAMESLASFADRRPLISDKIIEVIAKHKDAGSAAVKVRGNKLLKRLRRE